MDIKVYLSYSCRGYKGIPSQFIINLHKISAYYLKKNFKNVNLITDSISKKYFENIPWDSITTELDIVPEDYPSVWSLSKLYAYKIITNKNEPFIHVDNDVILWKGLDDDFLKSEVFAQSPEDAATWLYEPEKLYNNCPNLYVLENRNFLSAYNVGIFGGTNIDFIKEYSEQSIKFVEDPNNKKFWQEYKGYANHWSKATTAEQWFLGALAEYNNIKVNTLFPKVAFPSPEEAKAKYYTHMMDKKRCHIEQEKINSLANRIVKIDNNLYNLGFDNEDYN